MSEPFTDEYGFAYRAVDETTFDKDGYPTEDTLNRIASWQIFCADDVRACLDYAKNVWNEHYGSVSVVPPWDFSHEMSMLRAQKGERFLRFATGGWSANESVVNALRRNTLVNSLSWCLSARGGLHIFHY